MTRTINNSCNKIVSLSFCAIYIMTLHVPYICDDRDIRDNMQMSSFVNLVIHIILLIAITHIKITYNIIKICLQLFCIIICIFAIYYNVYMIVSRHGIEFLQQDLCDSRYRQYSKPLIPVLIASTIYHGIILMTSIVMYLVI